VSIFQFMLDLNPQLGQKALTLNDQRIKIIFSREYRIAKELLALGSNSSMEPWFLLTLAVPREKS